MVLNCLVEQAKPDGECFVNGVFVLPWILGFAAFMRINVDSDLTFNTLCSDIGSSSDGARGSTEHYSASGLDAANIGSA